MYKIVYIPPVVLYIIIVVLYIIIINTPFGLFFQMKPVFDTIYDNLTPAIQMEFTTKRHQFETLISFIRERNHLEVNDNKKLMKLLATFSQSEFKDMSPDLITEIKQAAANNSYQQSGGKRKKTYKRSSTKKSKSRRNNKKR